MTTKTFEPSAAGSASSALTFAVGDQAQQLIIRCLLTDAIEWQWAVIENCPQCERAEHTCPAHAHIYDTQTQRYCDLTMALQDHDGAAPSECLAISAEDDLLIAIALPAALAYRERREDTPASRALLAAYRQLAKR